MKDLLLRLSLTHSKAVIAVSVLLTLGFAAVMPRVKIDTDPENMLPVNESVRVHHEEVKEAFNLHDYIVVGVVREAEGGVFRPETLERVARLTESILDLDGVIADDVLAPGEVDDVYTEDQTLRVDTLMPEPPATAEDARKILARIGDNPVLRGKLASDDGQAMALFVPIEAKDRAHEIGAEIDALIAGMDGDETYYLAGIPLAEDRFGAQMFLQMAVGAPAAFALIFLLMLFFFRNVRMVAAPMIVSMMSVIWTMGLLIGTGFTVHIMSSMIPVFLIPIAVLDSIHLLSEFHERYPRSRNREQALRETIDELFVPMAYTSVTTMVGFASLLLTPIPPVQVFGGFVAFGIGAAWLLSMTFLIAYARLVPESALENFGYVKERELVGRRAERILHHLAMRRSRAMVVLGAVVFLFSVVGLLRIQVNDNPVNWFRKDHPIRVADRAMNDHLAGTYLAYLSLDSEDADRFKDPEVLHWVEGLQRHIEGDPNVGATTSIVDIVTKVRRELMQDPAEGVIPPTSDEVAQYLFLYEISGGDPADLFRLITPDSDRANVWIQMRDGENQDVSRVVARAEDYLTDHPMPGIDFTWAGLPYINIVWQAKMVKGMGQALAGSFVIVFLMMTWLFRSVRLGLLSMVPLTATIVLVYGAIGWVGKAYDMPIAVLSSLSLGLSIDFAIHFLQRARESWERAGDMEGTMNEVFGPPVRAILRNVFVISLGFVPMFFASLVPYVTVSVFFFAIMVVSGFTTIVSLPAILNVTGGRYLAPARSRGSASVASGVAGAMLLIAALAATPARAQAVADGAPDAEALMKASHLAMYYAADDGRAMVDMQLVDKKGNARARRFVMLRRDVTDGGAQKYFTYFTEPSDVRRTTFMVWKEPDSDDARWIYIPAVDLVRRISAKDKGSSFVGSDFSYEDVSGRHWTDDTHEFLRTEELDGRTAHVVQSVPREKDAFSRKVTWVDAETSLPLREEYYDRKNELERVFTAERIETVEGHPTIVERRMVNVKKEHTTTVTFEEVSYDVGVADDVFTERHLKAPPKELLEEGGR
jgi:hypothetical protein